MYKIFEELLQKHGVTAYKVSKETGIATSTLSDWKKGKSTPKQDKLQKIADYFGITLAYLLGIEEQEDNVQKNNANTNTFKKDFPMVPEHFNDPEEARTYVTRHQIFGYGGFDPYKMTDEDILEFANEMLNQAEILGYKYSMKQKDK